MSKRFEIDVVLNGKDNGATGAVDKVAQRLRAMRAEERASGELLLERSLKSPEGLASGLAGLAGIGQFGIAAIAIDRIAEAAERAAKSFHEWREGKKELVEIVATAADGIPIFGSVRKAVSAWTEELLGLDASDKKIAAFNEKVKEQAKAFLAVRDAVAALDREITNGGAVYMQSGAGENPYTKEVAAADKKFEQNKADLEEQRKKLPKMNEDQRKEESAKIDQAEIDNQVAHNKALRDIDAQAATRQREAERRSGEALIQQQAELDARRLEQDGRMEDAEVARAQARAEAQKFALDEEEKRLYQSGSASTKSLENIASQKTLIEQGLADDIRAIHDEAAAKQEAADDRAAAQAERDKERQERQQDRSRGWNPPELSARFQGLAHQQQQRESQETEAPKTDSILKQILEAIKNPDRRGYTEPSRGIPLGALR